jgi:hypothetical protein
MQNVWIRLPAARKYISPSDGLDTLNISDMAQDINKKIEKLKDMAVGRCRERIDQAACKAKELLNRPKTEGRKKEDADYPQSSGITSFLRKRHGL